MAVLWEKTVYIKTHKTAINRPTFESATVKTENTTSVNYLPSRFDNIKFSVLFNLSLTTTRSMKGKSLKRRIKKKSLRASALRKLKNSYRLVAMK